MAPTIPITRHDKPDIGAIEKSLGIKWTRGLSRESGRLKIPIIRELEHALKQVIRQYANVLSPTELETSAELEAAANAIFNSLGARVWPDGSENPEWLAEATRDNLNGYYPENLFFSSEQHCSKLRHLFYSLVVAKCLMYVKNHGSASKNQRRSAPVSVDQGGEKNLETEHITHTHAPRPKLGAHLDLETAVPTTLAYILITPPSPQPDRPRAQRKKSPVKGTHEVSTPNLRSLIVVLKVDPQKLARVLATRASVQNSHMLDPEEVARKAGAGHDDINDLTNSTVLSTSRAKVIAEMATIPERDFSITFQGLGYIQQSIQKDDDTQASAPLQRKRLPQPSTITPADPDMGQVREMLPRSGPIGMEATSHDRPQELESQVLPRVASCTAALHDTGYSLEPDLFAILEKAEVEVDWETPAVPPSFISLEACNSIDDLFVSIDGQTPLPLRHRRIEAVNIEHTNHQGAGKPITGYVRRGEAGVASFRALFRRLKKLDAATELELRVTIEWAL
ncbi:hypothetical protein LTS12_012487 [Elasticomyces elasticus]|nr:hypothetical protein LTS12_012487 [Elasticomyces elasticus]